MLVRTQVLSSRISNALTFEVSEDETFTSNDIGSQLNACNVLPTGPRLLGPGECGSPRLPLGGVVEPGDDEGKGGGVGVEEGVHSGVEPKATPSIASGEVGRPWPCFELALEARGALVLRVLDPYLLLTSSLPPHGRLRCGSTRPPRALLARHPGGPRGPRRTASGRDIGGPRCS